MPNCARPVSSASSRLLGSMGSRSFFAVAKSLNSPPAAAILTGQRELGANLAIALAKVSFHVSEKNTVPLRRGWGLVTERRRRLDLNASSPAKAAGYRQSAETAFLTRQLL